MRGRLGPWCFWLPGRVVNPMWCSGRGVSSLMPHLSIPGNDASQWIHRCMAGILGMKIQDAQSLHESLLRLASC